MLEENPTLESENEDLMDINMEEENPEISLHAITGINHPNAMRLIGWIENHKIIMLVDSGSTHNFLDSSMGRKLKVSISKEQRIRVKVANGEEVMSEGKCMQLKVQLHNFFFFFFFFSLLRLI
jgi:predicted aspartyl protease